MPSNVIENNFRTDRLPHIWCPGCGHGILMRAIAVAIEELGLDKDDQIIGYKYVHLGKMMDNIKKGIDPMEAIEKASGTYGRFNEAVKKIDPRKQ